MSEKYPHLPSYIYCDNDPMMMLDSNGTQTGDFNNRGGGKVNGGWHKRREDKC